ncbi:DUF2798 domain-containing protein [Undibacterium sp. SXout11W]|uniref:DUF2798 domain-containing protein n=1 Tax=Undibacterium sp. SXout11W TaxID=3413050 RepID=UPI003BF17EC8
MQHLSVYSDKTASAYSVRQFDKSPRLIAGSRSLASMMPSLLSTGLITLLVTAFLRLVWIGFDNEFFGAWMEAWLTTWPIAFPLAYLSKPVFKLFSKRSVKANAALEDKAAVTLNSSLAKRAPPYAPYFR